MSIIDKFSKEELNAIHNAFFHALNDIDVELSHYSPLDLADICYDKFWMGYSYLNKDIMKKLQSFDSRDVHALLASFL